MAATRTLLPALGAAPRSLSPALAPARARAITTSSRSLAAPLRTSGPRQFTYTPPPSAAQHSPGGLAGLFHNAGQMVTGFIPGIAHFVGDALKDTAVVPHVLLDLAKGDFKPSLHRYLPATTAIGTSIVNTAHDVVDPRRFLKAWHEGNLVSKIVEDVGNAALIGGPLAKMIGAGAAVSEMTAGQAARIGATEATAEQISRAGLPELTAKIAEGPAGELASVAKEPTAYYTKFRGAAGRAAEAGDLERAFNLNKTGNTLRKYVTMGEKIGNAPALPFQKASELIGGTLGAKGITDAIVSRLPEEARWRVGAGKVMHEATDAATNARIRLLRHTLAPDQLSRELGLSTPEDRAALFALDHTPENLQSYDKLTDQQVADILNEHYADMPASERPTVADARMGSKYSRRDLPDEQLANIDKVSERVAGVAEMRKQRALDDGTLNPEQLGQKLRLSEVKAHTDELLGKRGRVEKVFNKATEQLSRRERAMRIQDVRANDLPDPTAMNRPEIRTALESVRGQLEQATNEYETAMAHGTAQQQVQTGAKVDVLLDQAEGIKAQAGWQRPERYRFTGRDAETGQMQGEFTPTGNPSPNERVRIRQGTLAERHNVATQRVSRLQRSMDAIDERLANVEQDLGQSFQDRYHTSVNLPSITRLTNAMFRGTSRLGTLLRRHGYGDIAEGLGKGALSPDDIAGMVDLGSLEPGVRAQFEHSILAENTVGKITDELAHADASTRLNSPHRVKDVIEQAKLPDSAINAVEKAWDDYTKRSTNVRAKVYNDWTKAIPARYRRSAMWAQRHVSALMDMAERENAQVPGSGNEFLQQAEETMTTLQDMVESGFDPVHLTGGEAPSPSSAAGRGFNQQRLTQSKQRGEHAMTHGFRELGTQGYGQVESQAATRWVTNKRNALLGERMGKRLDDFPEVRSEMAAWNDTHPGETMPSSELNRVLRNVVDEDGHKYASMNPQANLTPESVVVPKRIYDALDNTTTMNPVMRRLARSNRAFKTWVLPFSPRWQVGNAVGNVLQASMHAGVSPLELARYARSIIKDEGGFRKVWANEGLPADLPADLTESGLTHGETSSLFDSQQAEPRTRLGKRVDKIARGSYKFNSVVDNLTRSSVFLAKLGEGEGSEAALRTTLRSLGDYTKLSPFERNTVKQIFPFYAWLKHSLTATARLPITSPTRAAFYAHLQNLYDDDPDVRKLVGQGFRIGNTSILDAGSLVPLSDIGGEGALLNPQNWGASLAPGIKFATSALTGWDLNAMKPLTRPGGSGEGAVAPLAQLAHNPAAGIGELAWQASQQGPTQLRQLRDFILGEQVRYSGTGYRTDFTNPNRRNLWQLARIAGLPSVRYEPRLTEGNP